MKYFLLIVALFAGGSSFGQVPGTGVYYDTVTVRLYRNDTTKTIWGNFNAISGKTPNGCVVNFKGQYKTLKDKKVALTLSWADDSTATGKGTLVCISDTDFTIKFKTIPPSAATCSSVSKDGYQVARRDSTKWIGIRMARNWKTFFYIKPDVNWRDQPFITRHDILGILEVQGDWVRAEYIGYNLRKPVHVYGWVKMEDLYENKFK